MDQVRSSFFSAKEAEVIKRGVQKDFTSMLKKEQYETINSSVSYLPSWFNVLLSVQWYLKAALPYAVAPCSS